MANTQVEVRKTPPIPVPANDAFRSMRAEMENLFDRFGFGMPTFRRWFDQAPPPRTEMTPAMPNPAMDIAEDDKAFRLTAELPGMAEQDVEVTMTDDMLTIKGEKKQETEQKENNYTLTEQTYGVFQRTFWLPEGVDRDKIEANFAKGVLTVTMPKLLTAVTVEPKKIEVKAAA